MPANIIQDFLKPRNDGKTNQGYFIPKHPEKYIGDISKICYRSGWEFDFLYMCDDNRLICKYSSEKFVVPYINPLDNRKHDYYIDMYVEMMVSDGSTAKLLLEIKPIDHMTMPDPPKRKTVKSVHNYRKRCDMVIVNIAKFKAAKYYAKQFGMMFGVVTRDKISGKFSLHEWNENQYPKM